MPLGRASPSSRASGPPRHLCLPPTKKRALSQEVRLALKKIRLVHVCLITLLTPLLFSINSTNPYAQTRRTSARANFTRSAFNQIPAHGKPFVDIHAPMPAAVMRRPMAAGPKTRAGAPITAQTIDLTSNTPTVSDVNPFWSKDEQTIIFQSNRTDLFG